MNPTVEVNTTVPVDYKQLYEALLVKHMALSTSIKKESNKPMVIPSFSNTTYEHYTNLQYKVKTLTAQVNDFETGEKYTKMQAEHKRQLNEIVRENKRLQREVADAHCQVVNVRKIWDQLVNDMIAEHAGELSVKDRRIKKLEEKVLSIQILNTEVYEKFRNAKKELYQVRTELEKEKGKVLKLTAQKNKDYENSSIPSSMKPNHKKIANSREKTGKQPGGQPGHEGHRRKRHIPTCTTEIPAPEEYANNPRYKLTGKTITKQMVDIHVDIIVHEYSTPEFRHVITGQRVHADFPDGVDYDVNYSGNIRSFAFLLNNYCNVSVAKVSDFLSELTDGELKISTGMINGLSRAFSLKSEAERKKAYSDLLSSHAIHTDFTSARVNGKSMNVMVCATPSVVSYYAREHKGHKGIKDTPVEVYQGILIHDHDRTFYHYGSAHQECDDHALRHLQGSIENEPTRTWNMQMQQLVREMIHFRKRLDPEDKRDPDEIDPDKVKEFEHRYDEILNLAKQEYEYEPPNKYYREGFNLYRKMALYKSEHLLFLHDRRVSYSNSRSERLLRIFKRKQAQTMGFRSFHGLHYLCQSLGVVASLSAQDKNLYKSVASIFDRPIDRRGLCP